MKKKLLLAFVLMVSGPSIFAQLPDNYICEYITEAHDQLVQGPCLAHATIAGMEAMYKRLYNETINLSELALFSCSEESQVLNVVLSYVANNGAILDLAGDTQTTYPQMGDPDAFSKIWYADIDCVNKQIARGSRFKIVYERVTNLNKENIKKILLNNGPIIFNNCAASGFHVMLLIGWTADNKWIVKDSYPGRASIAAQYSMTDPYVTIADAYIIKNVISEIYNNNAWLREIKIMRKTIPYPLCHNQGIVYELTGDGIVNATITWSYTASSLYEKSLTIINNNNNKECIVSGNAANVKLCATITKSTGSSVKVYFDIGTVGVPTKLSALNGHCAGSNYEITSKIEHPFITGCTYSYNYNIPASSDGSYYVIKSGQYAYWVFKRPNGLQYSATVTANQTSCSSISSTQYAIIYSSWCGTSYKSMIDGDLIDSTQVLEDLATWNNENPEENSPLVSPNPVRNELTLNHIGKGTNDIRIYDLSGSLVYSEKTTQKVTIDVSMMPRGIYIVRYFVDDAENQVKPIKIVLE